MLRTNDSENDTRFYPMCTSQCVPVNPGPREYLKYFLERSIVPIYVFPWALRVARVFYEILKPVFAGYIDDSNYVVDTVDVARQTTLQGYLYFKVFNHTPAYQNLSSRNHRDFLGSCCIHALWLLHSCAVKIIKNTSCMSTVSDPKVHSYC